MRSESTGNSKYRILSRTTSLRRQLVKGRGENFNYIIDDHISPIAISTCKSAFSGASGSGKKNFHDLIKLDPKDFIIEVSVLVKVKVI